MPAIKNDGDVDIDDVAFEQDFVAGDAVANHMIDGCADGFGEAFVIEGRGYSAIFFGHFAA